MAFVGHPILDEIKTGIRLKPTKTIDKSAPIILADGERRNRNDRGSCPPPAPPLNSLAPPPPPIPRASSSSPIISSLREQKNDSANREKLLESIRGGIQLRKVQTKDKSSPIIETKPFQEEIRQPINNRQLSNGYSHPQSAHFDSMIDGNDFERRELYDDSYSTSSDNSMKRPADYIFNENDLYVTEEKLQKEIPTGKAALGKSIFDSPENISPPSFVPEHQRKLSLNSYLRGQDSRSNGPPDASFDENALKVTSEALRREIPAGTASGKIARFANGEIGQTNSLPRFRFKPGQIRSPFHESDTNLAKPSENESGGTLPRAKSPSTGFLTQRQNRPLDLDRTSRFSPESQSASLPSQTPPIRSSSITPTPQFVRSLFDRPSLPNIQPIIDEQPPPPKSSMRPYESVYSREFDRSHSNSHKSQPSRSNLITPAMALGAANPKIESPRSMMNYGMMNNPSNPQKETNKPVSPGMSPISETSRSATYGSNPKPESPRSRGPKLSEAIQMQSTPTIVPNPPQRRPESVNRSMTNRLIQQLERPQSSQKNGLNGEWSTITASHKPQIDSRGRSEDRGHIIYTVHNGQPKANNQNNNQVNHQISPRPRSTSRPAWRDQSNQSNGPSTNGYTYNGITPSSSSSFTYNQPNVHYTSINLQPSSARQPRVLHHTRSASEMSRPIAVRTDFLPTSPLQSVEPSPISPLRPLEVRDVHTSPMTSISARSPFNTRTATNQQITNRTNQSGTQRQNGRASSPESSMSSQQSPSSLSPGSTSPRDSRNNNNNNKKYAEDLPSMPRPFFGTYRTQNSSNINPQQTSHQADALKAAVLEAAWNKTSSPQRLISVPISSPWHNQNKMQSNENSVQNRRVISPQEICHLNPESMRGNFRFNIDMSNENPLSISRR